MKLSGKDAFNTLARRRIAQAMPDGVPALGAVDMQRVLEKMAKQLAEYDEASLMQLWQHYASKVHDFEPTKRWEEAALAFCLIQAVHWKNQLFNYHLALTATPPGKGEMPPLPDLFPGGKAKDKPSPPEKQKKKATVLPFPGSFSRTDVGTPDGDAE